MEYPRYFLTYCVMGKEAGSNPLGHACLVFSCQSEQNALIEVLDAVGYYSQQGAAQQTLFSRVKKLLGFNFDISNVHGRWQFEEMRYLDRGGLSGRTFELSQQQYHDLSARISRLLSEEAVIIDELSQRLQQKGVAVNGTSIFNEEMSLHPSSPRLLPFKFEARFDWGLDTRAATTCKTEAIRLMQKEGIALSELDKLYHSKAAYGIPRFSGVLTDIKLFSTGPLHSHKCRNGLTAYYRCFKDLERKHLNSIDELADAPNRLYWLFPPQQLVPLAETASGKLDLSNEGLAKLVTAVNRLQLIEYKLIKHPEVQLTTELSKRIDSQLQAMYLALAQFDQCIEQKQQQTILQQANSLARALEALYNRHTKCHHWQWKVFLALSTLSFIGSVLVLAIAAMVNPVVPVGVMMGAAALGAFGVFNISKPMHALEKEPFAIAQSEVTALTI